MLESLVASILNRVLGSYVENFDPKQLRIGLLSGDVKLGGLKLKRGALDQLQLPINVAEGHIGSLILQIPYSNLKSKPVKVFIEDVFLIAKPDMDHEDEGQKRREQAAKIEKLQVWEISSERAMSRTSGASAESEAERAKQQNFTSSLVSKIIENLQVTIRNIHVRFEDLDTGVALGATLGELSAISTNRDWEPAFINDVGSRTHKLATLDSLAFYIDPEVSTAFSNAQSYNEEKKQQLLEEFKALIFDSIGATDILRPINGQGFITMNKNPESESVPRVQADLKFEELSVNLDREQYVDALRLTQQFQSYFNTLKYRKHRPRVTVKEDPLAWFRYAANTALDGVRERRRRWTWEYMKQHLEDQKQYIEIYKKWNKAGGSDSGFTAQERTAFKDIQERCSYEDLVFFRSLAKKELVTERKDSPAKPQSSQTWSDWLWGSKPSDATQTQRAIAGETSDPNAAAETAAPIEITDEQRQELLDVLDVPSFSEDTASQVLLSVEFSLRGAGIRLKDGDLALASAGFEGVKLTFLNRPDSFSVEMGVAKFEATDLTRKNQFSQIIRVQHAAEGPKNELFFWFLFEHHPLNHVADSNLFVKSQSMIIVHNARLMESITDFFLPPAEQGDTVDAILVAANRTVEDLRQQTRIGLEYALEHHKTLNLQLDIRAPTIVIPLDTEVPDSAAAVLDVGSLQMASDLVPHNVLNEVKSKQALKYSESDWKRLESLMYDRFTVKLCDTQILLGERMSDITNALDKDSSKLHFLDKATLQFLVEVSIVPNNHNLARCRVSITLPNLRATLADVQYLLFMKILSAAVPKSNQNSDAASVAKAEIEEKDGQKPTIKDLELLSEKNSNSGSSQSSVRDVDINTRPQRMLEILFVVHEVNFFIVRGWDAKPLIDLCLHEFRFNGWTNTGNAEEAIGVDIAVRDLLITDHTNHSAPTDLRKFAESAGHADDKASESNLFGVEYRKSPSGDMDVLVNLAAIRFNFNPDTVLIIYDYVMSTFTSPSQDNSRTSSRPATPPPEKAAIESSHENTTPPDDTSTAQSKITVKMNMHGILAVLADDNEAISTLTMERATLNVELAEAMKAHFVLGTVGMVDNKGNDLLSIETGKDLADFRYETQPLGEDGLTPTGPANVYLRLGRVKLQILEEPLTRTVSFLTRFTAMKAAYDQARMMAFNQTIQVQPGMFKFDINISTPIITWPRESDWIRFDLGEVFVQSYFRGTANKVEAGVRNVQITSSVHDLEQEIVPKTDFSVTMIIDPDNKDVKLPITSIRSGVSPMHFRATEHQYEFMMRFLKALSNIFAGTASAAIGMDEVGDLRRRLAKEKHIEEKQASYWWGENFSVSLGGNSDPDEIQLARPKFSFEFEAPLFDITLDLDEKPLSRFAIREVVVSVDLDKSSVTEANFHIRSFSAEDLGNTDTNKFPQIIPPVSHDGYQVMGRLKQQPEQPLSVECSVDSPQVIVALEYMLTMKKFLEYGNINDAEPAEEEEDEDLSEFSENEDDYESSIVYSGSRKARSFADAETSSTESSSVRSADRRIKNKLLTPVICINVVDMYLTVLADERDEDCEAIVFKIEQLVLNTGNTSSITLSKVGMFLTKMKSFEKSKLRILDDFNITSSIDNSESTETLRLANVQIMMEPLILRISLREIELVLDIANKASAIWASGNASNSQASSVPTKKATKFFFDDHRVVRNGKRSLSISDGGDRHGERAHDDDDPAFETMEVTRVLAEQLNAQFEGIRLVLIDPVHQLPMVDFSVKPFALEAKNWSDSLVVNAKAELFANSHSFTKSAWEPLVDTMELGLTVTGEAVEIYSNSVADIELTPETLELARDIQAYFNDPLSSEHKRVDEDEGAPYRIRNETGVPITVWADSEASQFNRRRIANEQEIKWSFHDWRQVREDLNATDQDARLGLQLNEDGYDLLRSVPVNRVGEYLYVVDKKEEKTRLVFDIWVENHLKYITIRSTMLVKNHTETPLEVMLVGSDQKREVIKLPVHSEKALPLSMIDSRMLVRREGDSKWPNRSLYWQELAESGKSTLKCADDFFLSVNPEIPNVPLSKKYPYLVVNLAAPFQIVNNLPVGFGLRLYSREMRRENQRELDSSGRALVHDYSEDVLLLLRVDIPDYTCTKFAVINTGNRFDREFHIEDTIEVMQGNHRLQLKIGYNDLLHGEGRVIVVYSPYVIVNSSEHELLLSSQRSRAVCPPSSATLWSFNHLDAENTKQRATISSTDSVSSIPVSFDASGSASEVVVVSRDRRRDLYLGMMISQGPGRYVNTKLVTIAPRFILCNSIDRPLVFREPGGRSEIRTGANDRAPVGFLWSMAEKEMSVKFGDTENADWSSSFSLSNVGTNYVRVTERGKPTVLAKVEVILEGATLFAHISRSKSWPYSIRNFTDREFIFHQSDPLVDEDGAALSSHSNEDFTPITYRLPPKSAMPYSWDFPAASVKQLVIEPAPSRSNRAPSLPARPSSISSDRTVERDGRRSSAASVAESVISNTRDSTSHKHYRGQRVRRRKVQLAEIGELPPANFANGVVVDLSVIADGPQQALVIAPHNPEASNYDAQTNKVKAEALAEVEAIEASTGRNIKLKLKGIGISCINYKAQELLYVTLRNVKVDYNVSDALESLSLQVQWIQVDNTLPGSSDFPVIIYPTVLPKAVEEMAAHPCFSTSVTRIRDDSYGLTYIKHATLLLQEMTIEADEDFLLAVVDLVISLTTRKSPANAHGKEYQPLLDDTKLLSDESMNVPSPKDDSADDIYFEQLHLQPIQLNLSFMRTGSLSSSTIFKDNNVAGSMAFVIDALTLTIGNINDAPLRFNALLVDNIRTEISNLAGMIQIHYQQEFIYQLHKIVGSADIIGNPVGLFNNISSGVMDLFYEPYLGYTLNDRPREFGVGLAKGGLSFMKKSVFGVSDSVSKVTGALSKGLTAMTLDSRYQTQQRARRTRNRPRHAVYGFKYGVESLYESFSSGIMGLAEAPMQGAITDGGAGFFRGLGVGLLGLPTKTTIGLLDFASNLTEGIRNTTTVFDTHEISRVRLPRVISTDGVVRPYNVRDSVGQMILYTVKDGRYKKDRYLAHSNITKNKVVVVSMERILTASINDMELEWSLSYDQVEAVSVEATGIVINLLGGAHGPFIPLSEESTRMYIYKNIGKGVEEYNRRKLTLS